MNKMLLGPMQFIKNTGPIHNASVIFLHGSGDTGEGLLNWIKFLDRNFSLPHVKFILPTAPTRPYTYIGGELSTVWFDRYSLSPEAPEHNESLDSISQSIKGLIKTEIDAGIPVERIIIGGFSMGGALALHMGYRYYPGLAGVFALSSFLNSKSAVYEKIESLQTPLFMCHGNKDDMVPIEWGKDTYSKLQKLGIKAEFTTIENTYHELEKSEIQGLLKWIKNILPNTP